MVPDVNARLTGSQAAEVVGVSKQLINYWRISGRLKRGDDRRYRYGDVLAVERDTRRSGYSHRIAA